MTSDRFRQDREHVLSQTGAKPAPTWPKAAAAVKASTLPELLWEQLLEDLRLASQPGCRFARWPAQPQSAAGSY